MIEQPVRLSVGEHTGELGTVTIDPDEPVPPQIAELLRAVADELENTDEDDGDGED